MARRHSNVDINLGRLRVLEQQARAVEPVLKQAGVYLVSQAQAAFKRQGYARKWPERATPNVPGIVADLNAGGTPKARRFQGRPAGVDTGALRASLSYRIRGTTLEWGSRLRYAGRMQRGGPSRLQMTRQARKGLYDFLKRNPQHQATLGYLFSKKTQPWTWNVRPRPFVAFTREDRKVVDQLLRAHMKKRGAGGRAG